MEAVQKFKKHKVARAILSQRFSKSMPAKNRRTKGRYTIKARVRKWLQATGPDDYHQTITVPSWHPLYESPLQLQYPLHYDESAIFELVTGAEGREDFPRWVNLKEAWSLTFTPIVEIQYVRADFTSDPVMATSPPFFMVALYKEMDHIPIHRGVVESIKEYMEVDEPIVRYFIGCEEIEF